MSDTAQPGFDTPSSRPNARRDLSASAIAAGLVAVLVSFGGTAVLMVQAGHAAGLDAARIGSWIGSLSLVLGLGGAAYSLRTGLPIVMAWSTPGAALLVTALAGVLLNFGMGIFTNVGKQPALVLAMCAAYLVCRRWAPRYAVLMVMAVAVAMAAGLGLMRVDQLDWHLTEFVWTTPAFSMQAAVSLGVPLFVVAMASQNLPGLAILQAAGYRPPASRLVAATGFLGLLAAPFGAHSVTLGAISAAICTGPEAHAEPSKRYIAAATYGISYFALSIVAGAVAVFFQALPAALLAALAGLALLGTIMGGMAAAMANPQRREAALITLLATASGFSFWGIGSAFWGLVAGLLAHTVFEFRRKPAA